MCGNLIKEPYFVPKLKKINKNHKNPRKTAEMRHQNVPATKDKGVRATWDKGCPISEVFWAFV
jgi:hypothetical protein